MIQALCRLTPDCQFPPHAASDHPCGRPIRPGDPCAYCGGPQDVVDGQVVPCPKCWSPARIADLKGLAAEQGWDTVLTDATADGERGPDDRGADDVTA
jgi:hypothetical protein